MIPEESLRQAAQRAQEALLDSLPETPAAHTFSPAYRRKLARLARRMDRKPRPPHWVLHRVAGILLAAVCLGGVVLGTNAQARGPVVSLPRGRRPEPCPDALSDHRAGGVPAGRGRVGRYLPG